MLFAFVVAMSSTAVSISMLEDIGELRSEAGQLAIVAVFLPVAFAARGTWAYRRVVLAGGSALIALLAAIWLAERAFDLQLGLI